MHIDNERLLIRRFDVDLGKKLVAVHGIGRNRAYKLATVSSATDETLSAILGPKVCCTLRNLGLFEATIAAINATAAVVIDEEAWWLRNVLIFKKEV